uniref:Uncharacterized protein n=1 Tax=Heterorhabditis bacteriophora TaxID=37862 RepID=A0A1I7WV12_HETBA
MYLLGYVLCLRQIDLRNFYSSLLIK